MYIKRYLISFFMLWWVLGQQSSPWDFYFLHKKWKIHVWQLWVSADLDIWKSSYFKILISNLPTKDLEIFTFPDLHFWTIFFQTFASISISSWNPQLHTSSWGICISRVVRNSQINMFDNKWRIYKSNKSSLLEISYYSFVKPRI